MIRVIYRWKVSPGRDAAFAEAWQRNTAAIRASVAGAQGSLLLRGRDDPSCFVAVARWSSLEAWTAAQAGPIRAADPQASAAMRTAAGAPISTEVYDELADLTG